MGYNFRYDWFSWHVPTFERELGHLKGRPSRALEIGTHEGRSATYLLDHILTHEDSRLIAIDVVKQRNLDANLAASGSAEKVDLRIGLSREILRTLEFDSFDFIYVDGSHWACDVLEDGAAAFRLLKVGGILAFDDYLWDDPAYNQHGRPKPAIDALLLCHGHMLEVIENGYQVWVRKTSNGSLPPMSDPLDEIEDRLAQERSS